MFDDPNRQFTVVVNDEEQNSIWPAGVDHPNGWRMTGPVDAPRRDCLDYIDRVWIDMRPRNIREGRGT